MSSVYSAGANTLSALISRFFCCQDNTELDKNAADEDEDLKRERADAAARQKAAEERMWLFFLFFFFFFFFFAVSSAIHTLPGKSAPREGHKNYKSGAQLKPRFYFQSIFLVITINIEASTIICSFQNLHQ